ncbi:MAG: AAA family ATPase [Gammaproteobacteria bacterium]|nr:AAA family ATPase [Gammaproteobacteria bacterium]
MERLLKKQIYADLNDYKMILLAGPRQVGKTTLAKSLYKTSDYMNWDIDEDRTRILDKEFKKAPLWIFDEVHKYLKWRNYLKGIYDKTGTSQKILVTGSAQLDILRKGGDSLQGRYYFLRLMPLTFSELKMSTQKDAQYLYHLSGFPEPFLKGSKSNANRWSRFYRQRVVREEISSNEQFNDLATIEIMYNRLPDLAGGTLSINSLAENIQVSNKTLGKWVDALERLYAIFRLSPFGSPQIKALKKLQKVFLYDWNAVHDEGNRFENFIAVHLLKWIYYEQDINGRDVDLRYYRDKYGREVDFVITENGRPIHFIEAKLSDSSITKGLSYLKSKFPDTRATIVHLKGKKDFINSEGVEHLPVHKLLTEL